MAILATATPSAALDAIGTTRSLLHPAPSLDGPRLCRLQRPPSRLSAARPRSLRPVASFNPSVAAVTKAIPAAVASAASGAAAALTSPSVSEIAVSLARMLVDGARAVATRMGDDLSAPWMAAVAGAGRCLELYREIMLVRCLLTWFPNVPWERQPFSAMRDLCDPFLRLFQRICPPVFGNTLDISSLLAFTALGVLARILSPTSTPAF